MPKRTRKNKKQNKVDKNKNKQRKNKSKIKGGKKDYTYRGTWKHKLSRARNKAKRGGLTKKEMFAKYGRFPKKSEWWGPEKNEKEWKEKWIKQNPKYKCSTTQKKR
eukprot:115775_1